MNKLNLTLLLFSRQLSSSPRLGRASQTNRYFFCKALSPQFKALLGDDVLGTLKSCSGDPADKIYLHLLPDVHNCMARL